jgi:hypothetical protein
LALKIIDTMNIIIRKSITKNAFINLKKKFNFDKNIKETNILYKKSLAT